MIEWTNGISTLYRADAREIPLPDASVHCVVMSPPYWGLRDYGLGRWQGGDAECQHSIVERPYFDGYSGASSPRWRGRNAEPVGQCDCGAVQQAAGIGMEPTLGEWVESIVSVMREVKRVLRDDGTCWLNLGDAYATSPPGNKKSWASSGLNGAQNSKYQDTLEQSVQQRRSSLGQGLAATNMMGQPWRVAFALQDDGWILRSAITWAKSNPMPESVRDRPTSSYEMVFLLTKAARPTFWVHQDGYGSRTKPSPDYRMVGDKRMNMWRGHNYYYDAEAVREPSASGPSDIRKMLEGKKRIGGKHKHLVDPLSKASSATNIGQRRSVGSPTGRNSRDVWTIATQGRSDAHFASFPDELPRRCIKAGTSERGVCADCGAPWTRMVEKHIEQTDHTRPNEWRNRDNDTGALNDRARNFKRDGFIPGGMQVAQTLGWQPTCGCNAAVVQATVLDPFVGSGTTVAVAQALGRRGVGLDLNQVYLGIAAKRIGSVVPLLESL